MFIAFALYGCGGGGGGSAPTGTTGGTPTDTSIDFSLFPADYFTSYNVSADLTGNDNKGSTITGRITEQLQAQTTFMGAAALPVVAQTQFTASNGGFAAATVTSYFSTDASSRKFLGVSGDVVTASSSSTFVIPQTANIGDSGVMGTYTDNAGFVTSVTWRLEDGLNGNAKLVILNLTMNNAVVDNTLTSTYLIQPDGTRLSVEIVTLNVNVSLIVTLRGTY